MRQNSWECVTHNEEETDALGAVFAECVRPPCVIGLRGTLGAGKTRFVRSIVAGLGGAEEEVLSPTFVLCQHYSTDRTIVHHLDAYRIADDDEFLELGVDELFDSDALTLIEWPERVERCLPADRLTISILVEDENARRFRFSFDDGIAAGLLAELAQAWAARSA